MNKFQSRLRIRVLSLLFLGLPLAAMAQEGAGPRGGSDLAGAYPGGLGDATVPSERIVFVGRFDSRSTWLEALDASTGEELWRAPTEGTVITDPARKDTRACPTPVEAGRRTTS